MLWEITPAEVERLQTVLQNLAEAAVGDEARIDALPEVEADPGCSLVAAVGSTDLGLERVHGAEFRCVLTPKGWERVVGLLEPFISDPKPNTFQYLAEAAEGPEWVIGVKFGW